MKKILIKDLILSSIGVLMWSVQEKRVLRAISDTQA